MFLYITSHGHKLFWLHSVHIDCFLIMFSCLSSTCDWLLPFLQLSLSASKLQNRDVMSKVKYLSKKQTKFFIALGVWENTYFKGLANVQSDPMAVVYHRRRDGTLEELGRTEVCWNTLDPSWIVKISVTYSFEELQVLLYVTWNFFRYSRIVMISFLYTLRYCVSFVFMSGFEFMMWIQIWRMLELRW